MLGTSKNQNQGTFFSPLLKDILNPNDSLYILAEMFPWQTLEKEFAPLYSHTGNPSKPIRLMVGLILLKQLYNLGDETVVSAWVHNPYFQYFTGEADFQWRPPCDPSDLVHFRKRIGKKGLEKVFELSVKIQSKEDLNGNDIIMDTTVQEKNITYPTDAKLARKIIDNCNKIADLENVEQRQRYTRTVKKLKTLVRFGHHPKQKKIAKKAVRKLKTIAGRLVRELMRKLEPSILNGYKNKLELFQKVLNQNQNDKNKIYSLHEEGVICISKGKTHKKFEFGSKVSIGILPGSNIIVSVKNFSENIHDSKTIESCLEMSNKILNKSFNNVIVDRGYRGKKQVGKTKVILPNSREKTKSKSQTKRKKCRQRAAIEPVIGHLKRHFGLGRNYLSGEIGDEINLLLSATAFNLKHILNRIGKEGKKYFLFINNQLQIIFSFLFFKQKLGC
jgi:IS5 family transposase